MMPKSPRGRRILGAVYDFLCWLVAAPLAVFLRFDFQPTVEMELAAMQVGAVMGLFQVVAGASLHLYRGRYRFGSFDEVLGVVITTVMVGGATSLAV